MNLAFIAAVLVALVINPSLLIIVFVAWVWYALYIKDRWSIRREADE